ncbi:MAG: methyltransferase domain-containing protein [Nitrospirota bacterium]|nr:methyltransferase domain-containing protein [Nitrospirota bacterium]
MSGHDKGHLEREIELHKRLASHYEDRYRDAFSQVFQQEWNRALLAINRRPVDRVLELGCGSGILLKELKARSRFVVGFDVSPDMMRRARPLGAPLVTGNGSVLPFRDASFDLVSCRGVLHHLPDVPAALREIHRVLRPGGELILSEPSNDWWLVRFARELMYRLSDKFDEDDEGFRSEPFRALLHSLGFGDVRMERFGYSAYVLAGFPDHLPILRYVPGNVCLTKMLVRLDRLWARVPGLRGMSLQLLFSAKRAG